MIFLARAAAISAIFFLGIILTTAFISQDMAVANPSSWPQWWLACMAIIAALVGLGFAEATE